MHTVIVQRAKGERTRAVILEAALDLFAERGFDATTMRAIADRAGVSVGNAYYYFATKDHLIQGFYDKMAADHVDQLPDRLSAVGEDFSSRLTEYLVAWLEIAGPFRDFATGLFRNAADPQSPLSPFSAESAPARESNIVLLRAVVDGSSLRPPDDVRAELPALLWLFHMGVVLFWVNDRSPDASATQVLVRRTVPLVARAVELSQLPALRDTVADLVALVGDLKAALQPRADVDLS